MPQWKKTGEQSDRQALRVIGVGYIVKRDPIRLQGIQVGLEPFCSNAPGEEGR
jgi:hypothetical protein